MVKITNDLYESCKNLSDDDMLELMENSKSREEQDFYVNITNFFLQRKQKEVIEKGLF